MKIKSMNILALGVFIASLDITYLNGLSHALGNVLFLLRITIIVLLACLILMNEHSHKVSIFFLLLTLLYMYIIIRTLAAGGNILYAFQQLSFSYIIVIFFELLMRYSDSLKLRVINQFRYMLLILILIDILTMIVFPNGMFTTIYSENWFLGYKTQRLVFYLPFIILTCYIQLKKLRKIKFSTFVILIIFIGIFKYEKATSAGNVMLMILIFSLFINSVRKHKKIIKFLKLIFSPKIILPIYFLITVMTFSIQNSKLIQMIVMDVFKKDITLHTRLQIWQSCMQALERHPILGLGYLSSDQYCFITNNPFATSAHNMVLQILMVAGVIGLLIYVFIMLSTMKGSLSLYKMPLYVGIIALLIVGITSAEYVFSTYGFIFFSLLSINYNDINDTGCVKCSE